MTPKRTQQEKNDRIRDRLVKRLSEFALCNAAAKGNAGRQMTGDQVRAALGLLKKYMPDLKAIEVSGNPDAPVLTRIERVIIDPANDSASLPPPTGAEPL